MSPETKQTEIEDAEVVHVLSEEREKEIVAKEAELKSSLLSIPSFFPLYQQLEDQPTFNYYRNVVNEGNLEEERSARRVIANFMHVKAVLQQVGLDGNSPLVDTTPETFSTEEAFDEWVTKNSVPFQVVKEFNPLTGEKEFRTDVVHPEMRTTFYDASIGNLYLKQLYFTLTMRFLPNSQKDAVFKDMVTASQIFQNYEELKARLKTLESELGTVEQTETNESVE